MGWCSPGQAAAGSAVSLELRPARALRCRVVAPSLPASRASAASTSPAARPLTIVPSFPCCPSLVTWRSLVDDGVELLSTLRCLTQLNLQECWQVTDRGLEHLSGARSVRLFFILRFKERCKRGCFVSRKRRLLPTAGGLAWGAAARLPARVLLLSVAPPFTWPWRQVSSSADSPVSRPASPPHPSPLQACRAFKT